MRNTFHTFLQSFGTIGEAEAALLAAKCTVVKYNKGDFFVREGEVCSRIGFLVSGIARVYHLANDREYTSYFNITPRNRLVSSFESFLTGKPSRESIHFLDEAELVVIDREALLQLYSQSPVFQEMGRKMAEYNYILAMERIYSLQHDTAQARYTKLLHIYPDLMNQVPHHYIASYLGLTPESLSRIRKELMR